MQADTIEIAKQPSGTTPPSTLDSPSRSAFAKLLFDQVAEEDLRRLDPGMRETLAAVALDHLSASRGDEASIRLMDMPSIDATILEVVNDDMPFLLDSTLAALSERGIEPKLVAHPILSVERSASGPARVGPPTEGSKRQSLIHIHLPLLIGTEEHKAQEAMLALTYRDIRLAVADWRPMKHRLAEAIAAYKANPPPLDVAEIAEAVQFLEWLQADHFTFTGMRDYRYSDSAGMVDAQEGSGLGILSDPEVRVLRRGAELVAVTPEVVAFLKEPVALIITKANVKSRVHRRAHMDYVGVKLFDENGHLSGELRITGLFTSSAYNSTVRSIPYIRHKVARVFARTGFAADNYSGRGLAHVMESYPRDELFQSDEDTLLKFSLDILQLSERPRIRVLARLDRFDRFVSIMVYIPKDRYDSAIRRKVGEYLTEAYQGRLSAAYPAYPDGPLARTHFIIGRDGGKTPDIARETLEAAISQIVRTWADGLKDVLQSSRDTGVAATLYQRYGEAFSAAYREAFTPADSLADIARIERLSAERSRSVVFYRREGEAETRASLKVFARGAPSPLSQRVPLLEDLGFTVINERTYRVAPNGADESARVWLHDMTLERADGGAIDVAHLDPSGSRRLLMAQFRGLAESRPFRRSSCIVAGLAWREIGAVALASRAICARSSSPPMRRTTSPTALNAASRRSRLRARSHFFLDQASTGTSPWTRRHARRKRRSRDFGRKDRDRVLNGRHQPRRGPHPAPHPSIWSMRRCARISIQIGPGWSPARHDLGQISNAHKVDELPLPRPESTRYFVYSARASRACICASARSRAAACAGRTGRRISAPRCSAWSRPSRSRTPSSCRSAPRAASCPSSFRRRPTAPPG